MTLSPKEFSEGQKAYWLLEAYQRNPAPVLLRTALAFGIAIYGGIDAYRGMYWQSAWGVLAAVLLIGGLYRSRNTARKAVAFLERLKTKYGPEVYEEIKVEPTSLRFKLLQKTYPPALDRKAVQLP